MNLPRASVGRPIFTTMVTLIVVVIGAAAAERLRIDLLPAVELPTVSVRTSYQGASPEVMERLVTQVIEEIVATVPGVEELTSTSSEGSSRVPRAVRVGRRRRHRRHRRGRRASRRRWTSCRTRSTGRG